MMECVQATLLKQMKGIRHGFFCPGRNHPINNNLSYRNGSIAVVQDARKKSCAMIDIRVDHLTHVYQVHGTTIYTVSLEQRGAGALTGTDQVGEGDALITKEPSLPLAILIADCLPLFFADQKGRAVGLAHCGWKGVYHNLAGKMVDRFQHEWSIKPDELVVWIGPGISSKGFTVQNDVWDPFYEKWGHLATCFDEPRMAIDLSGIVFQSLCDAGIPSTQIEISQDCTYDDERYFSYRRDGAGFGHNMAVIQRD